MEGRRKQLLAGPAGDSPGMHELGGGQYPIMGCGGPSRGSNPAHHCAHQMPKGVRAASPCAKTQLLVPGPRAGKLPKGRLRSYGVCLSWCPPCLAQGAADRRKKPSGVNDSRFGGLHPPPAARSVLGPRLSAPKQTVCCCYITSPTHLLLPLLRGGFVAGLGARLVAGGAEGATGMTPSQGGAVLGMHWWSKYFHQALHWTGETKIRMDKLPFCDGERGRELGGTISQSWGKSHPVPIDRRVRLQQRQEESGRDKIKWNI